MYDKDAMPQTTNIVEATWKGDIRADTDHVLDPTVYRGLLGTAFTCLKSYEITRNHHDLLTCAEIIDTCANVARSTTSLQKKESYRQGPEEGGFGMSYDLLYGRAGFLWAALFLNRYLGEGTVPDHLLSPIVAGDHEACPLLYRFHGTRFWGAANGLAGPLLWLKHLRFFQKKENSVKQPLKQEVGFADGVAGNAYAFLLLYRLTGYVLYEERAKAFACYLCCDARELLLNMTRQEAEHDYSLFKGLAGPVFLLFDLVSPIDSKFHGFEI